MRNTENEQCLGNSMQLYLYLDGQRDNNSERRNLNGLIRVSFHSLDDVGKEEESDLLRKCHAKNQEEKMYTVVAVKLSTSIIMFGTRLRTKT